MGTDGRNRNGQHDVTRLRLAMETARRPEETDNEVVFDFSGLHGMDVMDLSLVLTARLQAGQDHRIWVRALPQSAWNILRSLRLDHLFSQYPSADEAMN
ncbi:MAG: hypothetical protein OEZ65_04790 [Gemmatimonadota bacterium]|nr:hypothetical protein [Gemmatimonadota bacterium]MDH5758883.1 hypothetical protein [Gemmatimonadota bacterium]